MAFPRLSTYLLLVSLALLCWTTSSADVSSSRLRRDLAFETREKIQKGFDMAKDIFSAVQERSAVKKGAESVKEVIKRLSKFASAAPGIFGALFSVVNFALALVPQDDPVLTAVKDGFTEVNKKLDSLSFQISSLATDVEWFNYASVYSQDELRILSAWRKFNEFLKDSEAATSQDEKLRLAEIFSNYYEYTGTEASVANLYHYLTIESTSLSENLNRLLVKKFECDIRRIGDYNLYLSTLLLEGMVLNQAYWKLIGLNTGNPEAEHTKMFQTVYKAQMAAVDYCLTNAEVYVKKDVETIGKRLSHDNHMAVAEAVKNKLDEKYDWYDWVVLVFKRDDHTNYKLFDLESHAINVGEITIAVGPTAKSTKHQVTEDKVTSLAKSCFEEKDLNCDNVPNDRNSCGMQDPVEGLMSVSPYENIPWMNLNNYVRATHVIDGEKFTELPQPFYRRQCSMNGGTSQMLMHFSRRLQVCSDNTCSNGGRCKQLQDSNDQLCECQDGYYGDTCDEKIESMMSVAKQIDDLYPVTAITGTNSRLKRLETKLDEVVNMIKLINQPTDQQTN